MLGSLVPELQVRSNSAYPACTTSSPNLEVLLWITEKRGRGSGMVRLTVDGAGFLRSRPSGVPVVSHSATERHLY